MLTISGRFTLSDRDGSVIMDDVPARGRLYEWRYDAKWPSGPMCKSHGRIDVPRVAEGFRMPYEAEGRLALDYGQTLAVDVPGYPEHYGPAYEPAGPRAASSSLKIATMFDPFTWGPWSKIFGARLTREGVTVADDVLVLMERVDDPSFGLRWYDGKMHMPAPGVPAFDSEAMTVDGGIYRLHLPDATEFDVRATSYADVRERSWYRADKDDGRPIVVHFESLALPLLCSEPSPV